MAVSRRSVNRFPSHARSSARKLVVGECLDHFAIKLRLLHSSHRVGVDLVLSGQPVTEAAQRQEVVANRLRGQAVIEQRGVAACRGLADHCQIDQHHVEQANQ
jgi:hypothetical protein